MPEKKEFRVKIPQSRLNEWTGIPADAA